MESYVRRIGDVTIQRVAAQEAPGTPTELAPEPTPESKTDQDGFRVDEETGAGESEDVEPEPEEPESDFEDGDISKFEESDKRFGEEDSGHLEIEGETGYRETSLDSGEEEKDEQRLAMFDEAETGEMAEPTLKALDPGPDQDDDGVPVDNPIAGVEGLAPVSVMESEELLREVKEEPREEEESQQHPSESEAMDSHLQDEEDEGMDLAQVEEADLGVPLDMMDMDEEGVGGPDMMDGDEGGSKRKADLDEEARAKKKKTDDKESDEKEKERKGGNLRKNIREVMDETQLDEATLAAQRQEMERLKRVQDQHKYLREVQKQIAINNRAVNKTQTRVISLLQGGQGTMMKSSTSAPGSKSGTVLVKLSSSGSTHQVLNKKVLEVLRSNKAGSPGPPTEPKPGFSMIPSNKAGMVTPSVSIAPVKPASSRPKAVSDVVTISSSSDEDDCIVISEPSEDESEEEDDDPNNSGMHTNDLYNTADEQGRVLINLGKPEGEPEVFLAPQIARIIKPHQIGGVRFLFDNVVESLERFNCSEGFGCILAHSMGLGKTLQVVSFCDVFLRETPARTVLCIMPINTLQNWMAEFNMWLPTDPSSSPLSLQGEVRPRNFNILVLNDLHKTINARARVVHEWKKEGGVLLIGYEMYRQLSLKRSSRGRKGKKKQMMEDEPDDEKVKPLYDEVFEALVKPGPDLVICDEGHRIKNSHASISHALKQIRTKRRIVLTGYPLQNNLLEYWCMVDFVRPNYLGSRAEFSNMFERPIQNGQCIDSTPQDIRLMRYRAHVLHSLLEGFVQRRSHAVLQHSLPKKEEYVLLVRMTPLQRKLYDTFMNEVVRVKAVPNPLKAFAVCCKIWNHPDILYNFLKKREMDELQDLDLEEAAALAAGRLGPDGLPLPPQSLTRGKTKVKGGKKAQAAAAKAAAAAAAANAAAAAAAAAKASAIKTEASTEPPPGQGMPFNQHPYSEGWQGYPPDNSGYQQMGFYEGGQAPAWNEQFNFNYQYGGGAPYGVKEEPGWSEDKSKVKIKVEEGWSQPDHDVKPKDGQWGSFPYPKLAGQPDTWGQQHRFPQYAGPSQQQPPVSGQFQQPHFSFNNQQAANSAAPAPAPAPPPPPPAPTGRTKTGRPKKGKQAQQAQQFPTHSFQPSSSNISNQMSDSSTHFPPHSGLQSSPHHSFNQQHFPQYSQQPNQPNQYPQPNQQTSQYSQPNQFPQPNQQNNQYTQHNQQANQYGQRNQSTNQFQQPNQQPNQFNQQSNQFGLPDQQNQFPQANQQSNHFGQPNQFDPQDQQSNQTNQFAQSNNNNQQANQFNPPSNNQQGNQFNQPNQQGSQFNTSNQQGSHFNQPSQQANQNNQFNQPNQQTDQYGSSNQGNQFGASNQPNNQFGATNHQANQFAGHNQQSNHFGGPAHHGNQFGGPQQVDQFAGPNQYSGSNQPQANQFSGPNQQQTNQFSGPNQENQFGGPNQQDNQFSGTNQYGQQVSQFGGSNQNTNQYTQNQQANQFGMTNQYGHPNQMGQYNQPGNESGQFGQNESNQHDPNHQFSQTNHQGNQFNQPSQQSNQFSPHKQVDQATGFGQPDMAQAASQTGPNSQGTGHDSRTEYNHPGFSNAKTQYGFPQGANQPGQPFQQPPSQPTQVDQSEQAGGQGGDGPGLNTKEGEGEDPEEAKKADATPKSGREEPGIPYDWAVELMKGYTPGDIEASAKMGIFFCILEESIHLGDRLLVFSQSLFTLNLLEEMLSQHTVPGREERWLKNVNYYRLDGSTSAMEREKLINEFNSNPTLHLFLVSTRAGSLGINLVGANRVIVFDASWNPCHDTQAVCRVYRYGQKKPCFVYRLVTDNCLEKKIYDRQINKQGMADRVVDECNPEAHLSIKEVTSLCWDDNETESELPEQDFAQATSKFIDVVLQKVLHKHSKMLTKEPFHHESLLVERKEKKLSQAEKRMAKRSYELEKQASTTNRPLYSHYTGGGTVTMHNRGVVKPMASVRPMQSEMGSLVKDGRPGAAAANQRGWIPAAVWQRQGMSAQEMTLPLDVVIPTNSPDKASIVLKAGQKVMVLKSPKGIYMQLENGKIIAIRTAVKVAGKDKKPGSGDESAKSSPGTPAPPTPAPTTTPPSIAPMLPTGDKKEMMIGSGEDSMPPHPMPGVRPRTIAIPTSMRGSGVTILPRGGGVRAVSPRPVKLLGPSSRMATGSSTGTRQPVAAARPYIRQLPPSVTLKKVGEDHDNPSKPSRPETSRSEMGTQMSADFEPTFSHDSKAPVQPVEPFEHSDHSDPRPPWTNRPEVEIRPVKQGEYSQGYPYSQPPSPYHSNTYQPPSNYQPYQDQSKTAMFSPPRQGSKAAKSKHVEPFKRTPGSPGAHGAQGSLDQGRYPPNQSPTSGQHESPHKAGPSQGHHYQPVESPHGYHQYPQAPGTQWGQDHTQPQSQSQPWARQDTAKPAEPDQWHQNHSESGHQWPPSAQPPAWNQPKAPPPDGAQQWTQQPPPNPDNSQSWAQQQPAQAKAADSAHQTQQTQWPKTTAQDTSQAWTHQSHQPPSSDQYSQQPKAPAPDNSQQWSQPPPTEQYPHPKGTESAQQWSQQAPKAQDSGQQWSLPPTSSSDQFIHSKNTESTQSWSQHPKAPETTQQWGQQSKQTEQYHGKNQWQQPAKVDQYSKSSESTQQWNQQPAKSDKFSHHKTTDRNVQWSQGQPAAKSDQFSHAKADHPQPWTSQPESKKEQYSHKAQESTQQWSQQPAKQDQFSQAKTSESGQTWTQQTQATASSHSQPWTSQPQAKPDEPKPAESGGQWAQNDQFSHPKGTDKIQPWSQQPAKPEQYEQASGASGGQEWTQPQPANPDHYTQPKAAEGGQHWGHQPQPPKPEWTSKPEHQFTHESKAVETSTYTHLGQEKSDQYAGYYSKPTENKQEQSFLDPPRQHYQGKAAEEPAQPPPAPAHQDAPAYTPPTPKRKNSKRDKEALEAAKAKARAEPKPDEPRQPASDYQLAGLLPAAPGSAATGYYPGPAHYYPAAPYQALPPPYPANPFSAAAAASTRALDSQPPASQAPLPGRHYSAFHRPEPTYNPPPPLSHPYPPYSSFTFPTPTPPSYLPPNPPQ